MFSFYYFLAQKRRAEHEQRGRRADGTGGRGVEEIEEKIVLQRSSRIMYIMQHAFTGRKVVMYHVPLAREDRQRFLPFSSLFPLPLSVSLFPFLLTLHDRIAYVLQRSLHD